MEIKHWVMYEKKKVPFHISPKDIYSVYLSTMTKVRRINKIENYSNSQHKVIEKKFKHLKYKNYLQIDDVTMTGDAPKDFIKAYLHEDCKSNKQKNWKKYIAKVGRKWYPIESITEYLCNRFGQSLGLDIAAPRLRLIDGQLRFLSKYFIKNGERLMHGAEIFSAYVNIPQRFIDAIDDQGKSRDLITFEFINDAIEEVFPNEHQNIMDALVKMIIFDSLIGNKDRHFYNYGVIVSLKNQNSPKFSPIYDTARGFFWNESDSALERKYFDGTKINSQKLDKYINHSIPKIGWNEISIKNHFELVNLILDYNPRYVNIADNLIQDSKFLDLKDVLKREVKNFYSQKRYTIMEKCLELRFSILLEMINRKLVN